MQSTNFNLNNGCQGSASDMSASYDIEQSLSQSLQMQDPSLSDQETQSTEQKLQTINELISDIKLGIMYNSCMY